MKIALFPYDFECISTLKHSKMLSNEWEIKALLAPNGFGLADQDANYLGKKKFNLRIKTALNAEDYMDLDAILFTESVLKIPLREREMILEEILIQDISVINAVFDWEFSAMLEKMCSERRIKMIDSREFVANSKSISLRSVGIPSERNRISTPILAVCGMAPMTQKFDLQLYYREHLVNNGYKVSQIGTKLNSHLFGFHSWDKELFDNSFSETEKIHRINQYVKDIETSEKPDIFILGVPDALMPYTQKHTFRYGIPAYEIFNAVTPDYTALSLFNGEYNEDFYAEIERVCNYKYNIDVDCFYNSCFVPVSLSVNAAELSYTYAGKKCQSSPNYQVFNEDALDGQDMYQHMLQRLMNYGEFKSY